MKNNPWDDIASDGWRNGPKPRKANLAKKVRESQKPREKSLVKLGKLD